MVKEAILWPKNVSVVNNYYNPGREFNLSVFLFASSKY